MLAGLGAGLGFLTKGPVALVVPAVVLLPIWWRERRSVVSVHAGSPSPLPVAAIVGLPWYVAMFVEHGAAYLTASSSATTSSASPPARLNEPRRSGSTSPIVIGGLMPWSAFLVALPRRRCRGSAAGAPPADRRRVAAAAWAVMPLLFFTGSIGKQPRYILPVLPPLAILLARSLSRRVDEAAAGDGACARYRAPRDLVHRGAVPGAHGAAAPRAADAHHRLPVADVARRPRSTAAAALALACVAGPPGGPAAPVMIAAAPSSCCWPSSSARSPASAPSRSNRWRRWSPRTAQQTSRSASTRSSSATSCSTRAFPQTRSRRRAARSISSQSSERVLLVIRDDVPRLEAGADDAAPIRRGALPQHRQPQVGTLLRPDPTRDVETVLLVTNHARGGVGMILTPNLPHA